MGFDLYFCWRTDKRLDFDEVAAWAKDAGNFAQSDRQLSYENPKTGVYFSLDFDPQGSETPENSPIPSGYFDSGLSFGLNFNRPSFFGYEAMPVVEQIAKHFGLSVVDPQIDADEPVLMMEVDSKELIDSWLKHNRWAILTLVEDPSFAHPHRMPIVPSLYLWRFNMVKAELERACGEEIFVPKLVPVHRKGGVEVGRGFTYTQGVPTIIPESEWVFVVRSKKSFFNPKAKQEVGVISMETFRQSLDGYIKEFQWKDPSVGVIRAESVGKVSKLLQSIDHMLDRPEFEAVGTDSFVDVELPAGV